MGPTMDETAKQAAQEYLAAKLTEEEQIYEAEQNLALATARSGMVWKHVKDTILARCREWNAITQEETLTCKETALGDLRVWCAARSKQMTVHYDPRRHSGRRNVRKRGRLLQCIQGRCGIRRGKLFWRCGRGAPRAWPEDR